MKWLLVFASLAGCGFGDNPSLTNTMRAECGDGVRNDGEGCDDGNTTSGDGCSDTCAKETANPVCGNGTRETGEACDDGNATANDGCSPSCAVETICGNGTRETGEACDDGNTTSGDGCSAACQVETTSACGLVPQSGCSGATPACDLEDDGDTACRAVTSMGTSNNHCTTKTACKAGYTCLGDGNAAHTPWCGRFCNTDADCLGTGSRCVIDITSGGIFTGARVCTNACDPYADTGCPSGMGCIPRNTAGSDYTDCRYMGEKFEDDACTATTECGSGLVCVGPVGATTCKYTCIVGNASTCLTGEVCTAYAEALIIGGVQYGACI